MHFTKMHGIGNDFVLVDCLGADGPARLAEAEQRAVFLCDRKFGVGGDGVIALLPGREAAFETGTSGVETGTFGMRMFNPDGSEAEMCGNGIRCFAKFLFDRGLTQGSTSIAVETGAGLLRLQIAPGPDGLAQSVRVDMGEPVLKPSQIPTVLAEGDAPIINAPLEAGDLTLGITAVSMGNPHAVTFVEDVRNYPVERVGPGVEHHPAFPRRTNTEFIQVVSDREIIFRVWERGAGETLACGTGACAAAVACVLNGKTGREVQVHLRGGDLRIEWSEADNHVYMTGSATEVFSGEL